MKKGVVLWFVLIGLAGLYVANGSPVKAQSTNIFINADGSVVGTSSIERSGDLYVLTGNISGGIVVDKSNIIIDGAGYTLQGDGGNGIDLRTNASQFPSANEIWNVTVRNLRIINFDFSVQTLGGGNDTFIDDYVMANTANGVSGGLFFRDSRGCNITYCTISGAPAIDFDFVSSGNSVTENNLSGGMWQVMSGGETVDRNYWSDYLTKYPNASEVDSSGIGNTPYVFNSYNDVGGVAGAHQDNHPLIKPVSIPNFGTPSLSPPANFSPSPYLTQSTSPSMSPSLTLSPLPSEQIVQTPSESQSKPFTTTWIIIGVVAVASVLGAGLLVHYKKRKR